MRDGDGLRPAETLIVRLQDAGVSLPAERLRSLMAGIVAAPVPPADPEGWMRLIVPDAPPPDVKTALRAYREWASPAGEGGLTAGKTATAARIAALRARLTGAGLSAFIVPRADAHQGEYVPPHAQRLAWLTAFTGSAGVAVVLHDRAALFVDGRYTLQAAGEVDTTIFTVIETGTQRPGDWLAEVLPSQGRVGYDPWLHTPEGLASLRKGAARAGGTLVPLTANPVDAVWPDQPAPPVAPVTPHDRCYAGEDSAAKRLRTGDCLDRDGAGAAVVTLPDSLAWLLNIRGGDIPHTPVALSFGIVHRDGRVDWFLDGRKLTAEARAALDDSVRVCDPESFPAHLDALADSEGRVLADPATAPAWVLDRLEAAGASLCRAADPIQALKACKNATELDGTRAAHERDGVAVARFLAWLDETAEVRARAGHPVTEQEAAEVLEQYRAQDPLFRDSSFDTIAGAGAHGAIVHYRVTPETDRPLQSGDLFLCDSGGQYPDGTTDITRTVVAGTPSEAMRTAYTRVLQGHIALATARFPEGTTGSQLDAFARRPLWGAGMDYDHGTGHGVGSYLGVHEGPQRISKTPSRVALQPGMICSNEPGYYKAGAYGIRLENLVAVTKAPREGDERPMLGFETLTLAPFCRRLIDAALLSDAERAWVDAYHARVAATLRPHLDEATALWLDAATAPLSNGGESGTA